MQRHLIYHLKIILKTSPYEQFEQFYPCDQLFHFHYNYLIKHYLSKLIYI